MELQAKARHLPFMTISARLYDRFKIAMGDDTIVERGYYIWRSIGNVATDIKTANVQVSSDLIVTLPQDCEFVRSLTTAAFQNDRNFDGSFGDYSFTPKGRAPEVRPDPTTVSVEANVRAMISTVPGERVDYKTYPGYLKITSPLMAGQSAVLIYNSIVTGPDGLPLLNDLEVEAIVVTLALREAEQDLFRGGSTFNARTGQASSLVTYLKAESDRLLCDAKSVEKISDDGLDQLLDIKTSWGRKVHNSKMNFQ
jgi:hypothetical protein